MRTPVPLFTLLLGAPTPGLDGLARALEQAFSLRWVDWDDVLRTVEQEVGTDPRSADAPRAAVVDAREVQALLAARKVVPDRLQLRVLYRALGPDFGRRPTLLTGFPRSTAQAGLLDELLAHQKLHLGHVLWWEVPSAALVDAMLARDGEGASASIDRRIVASSRAQAFARATAPLKAHYRERGVLTELDARLAPEALLTRVRRLLEAPSDAAAP